MNGLNLEGSSRSLNEKLFRHMIGKAEEYRGNSPKELSEFPPGFEPGSSRKKFWSLYRYTRLLGLEQTLKDFDTNLTNQTL